MNIDIRKAILDNIATNNKGDLEAIIVDAIQTKEEKVLPGLGFLFELIWEQSSQEDRAEMVENLQTGVKQATMH